MSTSEGLIAAAEARSAHNYHPLPVVVASADGAWMTDADGRRYLDMLAGYSALNFGHRNQRLIDAAKAQLDRVTLTSRAFHHDRFGDFCEQLAELCGMEMVLPMNTGAEAVETAVKTARKWGYRVKGVPRRPGEDHRRGQQLPRPHDDDRLLLHRRGGPRRLRPVHARLRDRPLRRSRRDGGRARRARREHGGRAAGADPGRGGRAGAAGRLPRGRSGGDPGAERAHDRGRDPVRSGTYGRDLRVRARGRRPRHVRAGQGAGRRCRARSRRWSPRGTCWASTVPASTAPPSAAIRWRARWRWRSSRCCAQGSSSSGRRSWASICTANWACMAGGAVREVRGRGLWAGVDIDPAHGTGRELSEKLMKRGVLVKDTHGSTIRIAPPLVVTQGGSRLGSRAVRSGARRLTPAFRRTGPGRVPRAPGWSASARRRSARAFGGPWSPPAASVPEQLQHPCASRPAGPPGRPWRW